MAQVDLAEVDQVRSGRSAHLRDRMVHAYEGLSLDFAP
jgi:hypothetical protein